MKNGEIRVNILYLTQFTATQAQVVTKQAQDMTAQANWEIGTFMNQNTSTMASRLRDYTRMNTIMFFGTKVNKDPQ